MVNTIDFRTKTVFEEASNPSVGNYWPVALDIGYSSVKGFSPNAIFSFPSYAKNMGKDPKLYGDELEKDEILYRDDTNGDIWRVGWSAQRMLDERDTEDAQSELYGRDRYFSQMFKVLIRTGLALAVMKTSTGSYNGKQVYVQTGLPPAYLDEDRPLIIDAIAGTHKFSIRTSRLNKFTTFDFKVSRDNVQVMSQPEGTLMSVSMNDEAHTVKEAKKYFSSNIIIVDAGFGTLDLFEIKNRAISSRETFSQFGMRKVFERTGEKIRDKLGVNIRPSAIQNVLERGTVTVQERNGLHISSHYEPFADILEESSKEVCEEAVEKILNVYPDIADYDYMILTGGTSAAWKDYFMEYLDDIEGLKVISGNENCPELDQIFTNVRGYYMFLVNSLRRM